MNDHRLRVYAAQPPYWPRLAALLPDAEDVELVQDRWDIGEQGRG